MNKVLSLFNLNFKHHKGPAKVLRVNWNNYYTMQEIKKSRTVPSPLWSVDVGTGLSDEHVEIYTTRNKQTIIRAQSFNAYPLQGININSLIPDEQL